MSAIATIGVYGFDAASFVDTLGAAGVTRVIDIRQRRGVRGSRYAWANAQRLQRLLADARIGYEHHPEFAPDTELRHLQYRQDAIDGIGKRSRVHLSPEFIHSYTAQILDWVPLVTLSARLPFHGIGALLCVEATAEACHRSLVARRLADRFGFEVVNLEPPAPAAVDLPPKPFLRHPGIHCSGAATAAATATAATRSAAAAARPAVGAA